MSTRATNRSGYTLIELLAAMTAASILLASLAATIVVSTNLLEAPVDDNNEWRDREIADRIATDLRYSTSIDETPSYGFHLTKANVSTGAIETLQYESYQNGLTRQTGSNAAIQLDENAPSHNFNVDGYTAPTYVPSTQAVRLRATSSASESSPVTSITCDYPPGCQNGDILVMVVTTNDLAYVTASGWNSINYSGVSGLRCRTLYQVYDSTIPGPAQANLSGISPMAVAMIAIENASESDPANWSTVAGGYANQFIASTHPSPLNPTTGTEPYHLNIRILAATGNPWANDTLGVASYDDAVISNAGTSSSVGIVVRNGIQPAMTTVPTFWQQQSGYWIQVALRVGNGG